MRSMAEDSARREPPDQEAQDAVSVRLMADGDLPAVVRIDAKHSGRRRQDFFEHKFGACVHEPRINTSLVAEIDGIVVGFLFGQLFFGEFGMPATRAVLDALGVKPGFEGQGVGRALMEQYRLNLGALRVEAIDTLVEWDRFDLLRFFHALGFRPSAGVDLVWDVERHPFSGRSGRASLRPATPEDLPAIGSIREDNGLPAQKQYFAAKLATAGAQPSSHLFSLAEVSGDAAGFLSAKLFQGEFGIDTPRVAVEDIAVADRYHHHGIGSTLMAQVRERARELGARHVETLVRWNDWHLLRFFEYVGFRPSSRLNLECRIGPAA